MAQEGRSINRLPNTCRMGRLFAGRWRLISPADTEQETGKTDDRLQRNAIFRSAASRRTHVPHRRDLLLRCSRPADRNKRGRSHAISDVFAGWAGHQCHPGPDILRRTRLFHLRATAKLPSAELSAARPDRPTLLRPAVRRSAALHLPAAAADNVAAGPLASSRSESSPSELHEPLSQLRSVDRQLYRLRPQTGALRPAWTAAEPVSFPAPRGRHGQDRDPAR